MHNVCIHVAVKWHTLVIGQSTHRFNQWPHILKTRRFKTMLGSNRHRGVCFSLRTDDQKSSSDRHSIVMPYESASLSSVIVFVSLIISFQLLLYTSDVYVIQSLIILQPVDMWHQLNYFLLQTEHVVLKKLTSLFYITGCWIM